MYPTLDDPARGVFVQSQMASIVRAGVRVEVEVIEGRRGPSEYVKAIGRVRRLARLGSFDLIHAHYGSSGFCASFQALPLVVSFCGDDLLGTPDGKGSMTLKSHVHRWLSYLAARRADGIICKSEQLRQALPRHVDRERARVIANGVDVMQFRPGDRSEARRRLGLGDGEMIVLFPHTVEVPRKRYDLAQAAIDDLRGRGVSARLLVVSGVPHTAMPEYYRAADCLLLTSDHEGSPNTVKEALCCDLPVVSVEVGDVHRWMSLVSGCAVVRRNASDIADGVMQVLGRRGRLDGSKVRGAVGIPAVALDVLEVYRNALVRRRASGQ